MSIKTWKKEFYPIKAKKMSMLQAVKHSLLKWQGTLPSNLKRHGVEYDNADQYLFDLETDEEFDFDSDSCALCVSSTARGSFTANCSVCPLYKHRKEKCWRPKKHGTEPPYGNNIKMIRVLKAVDKKMQEGKL